MAGQGIFLYYRGRIDNQVIDSLLMNLKRVREYQNLYTKIRKRTYSLVVECLENICRHSARGFSDNMNLQPFINVKNEENRIVISAGNAIEEGKRDLLIKRLEYINSLKFEELRSEHEQRLDLGPEIRGNGAGIGLICIALKSGNKLNYNFRPVDSGYLYFELEISIIK